MFNDMLSGITTILFDWGGVCCREGEPFASEEFQKQLGGKHTNDILLDVKDIYYDFYRGKYETEEFWRLILDHFKLAPNDKLNPAILSQAYLESYELWPEVLETARRLRAKYHVALLSDLTPVMKAHIVRTHELEKYFEAQIYSCDAGVNAIKNDGPKIFNIAMAKFNAKPEQCLFIDNSQSKIDVAEAMGMETMLFQSKEQFLKDIARFM